MKDDFQKTKTYYSVKVDENYKYISKNLFFKIVSFCLYYFFAFPVLSLLNFFVFGCIVKGRKKLRAIKKQGFIIYANHTSIKDSWLAPICVAPLKRVYIVSNKDAVQIPFVSFLTKALGVLPVADTVGGLKNMKKSISTLLKKKKAIMIFPEAHIWHYYTKLRPFPLTSFKFASQNNVPVVPVAVCYKQKRILGKLRKPKMIAYVGDIIYPNANYSEKENAKFFQQSVYQSIFNTLKKESDYAYYNYKKIVSKNKELDMELKTEFLNEENNKNVI